MFPALSKYKNGRGVIKASVIGHNGENHLDTDSSYKLPIDQSVYKLKKVIDSDVDI